MGNHYDCSICGSSPARCNCSAQPALRQTPPYQGPSLPVGAGDTVRQQAARIAELEYEVSNLYATQMEELARIGVARDCEKEEATAEIKRLKQQIHELEEEPWPQWCSTILNKMIEFGAWDPQSDGPEVDVAEIFTEWFAGVEDAEEREDIALQNFRLSLRNDVNDMATEASKINQWAVDRQKRPNSDYVEVATRMIEINRKMRADIRREEARRRTYYRPPEE